MRLERILHIHFPQQWWNLTDLACEEAQDNSPGLRRFVGIALALRHQTPHRRGQPNRTGPQSGGDTSTWHDKPPLSQ
jgi:hypothetical protein